MNLSERNTLSKYSSPVTLQWNNNPFILLSLAIQLSPFSKSSHSPHNFNCRYSGGIHKTAVGGGRETANYLSWCRENAQLINSDRPLQALSLGAYVCATKDILQFLILKRRRRRQSVAVAFGQLNLPLIGWIRRQSTRSLDPIGPHGSTPLATPQFTYK